MKQLAEKFEHGDHLTDAEMLKLYRAYQSVIETVIVFGDIYRLVLLHAVMQSQALQGFLNNRGVEV
jgi:hypothetical protein